VKNRLYRAKRLFEVQHQLYRMELSKLQAQQQAVWQARNAEQEALTILSEEQPSAIPARLAANMAAAANTKIRTQQASLEAQMAQTLDLAGKESVAKKRVETERVKLEKEEAKQALEAAIDAFLGRNRFSGKA
jgi:hypothetical protein